MSRKKGARITVPGEAIESRKAKKSDQFILWGANEPTFNPLSTEKEVEVEVGQAMNWYNAMTDEPKQREFLITYAEATFPKLAPYLKGADEHSCHADGILARCITRGAQVPDKWLERLKIKIVELARIGKESSKNTAAGPAEVKKKAPVDPMVSKCIGIVNGMLEDFGLSTKDKFPDNTMSDCVLKAGASNGQRLKVHENFSSYILELEEAMAGKDPDIIEAYSCYTKAALKKVSAWLTGLPSEDLVFAAAKKTPTPKRKQTTKYILRKFTCMEKDDDLKIHSIDPKSILGAEQLWFFNTKTRKLGVFYADSEKGLGINRKSISGYDEEKSVWKKIRKPENVVPGIVDLGKVQLRKVMDEINCVASPVSHRISNETILLRVIK